MSLGNIIGLVVIGIIVVLVVINMGRIFAAGRAMRKFFREVLAEMKNVAWPTQDEIVSQTMLVGVTIVIFVLIVGFSDYVFGKIVGVIFNFN